MRLRADVYSFRGIPGTEVWFDVAQTGSSLAPVVGVAGRERDRARPVGRSRMEAIPTPGQRHGVVRLAQSLQPEIT